MPLPYATTITGAGAVQVPLLLMEPNGVDSEPRPLSIQGEDVKGASGTGFLDKTGALPQTLYHFQFSCDTREKLAALESFFDARRGRYGAFWFPTWERPFEVANYHDALPTSGDDRLFILSSGYDALYPFGPAYRRYVLIYGGIAFAAYRVVAPADVGNPTAGITRITVGVCGGTELRFVPPIVHPYTEAQGVIPIALAWGRFDADELEVEHVGDGGIVNVPILECPDEATE
jgi:hypothetical protein